MNCLGGSAISPNPGYWRSDKLSDNFVKCENYDACLGGEYEDSVSPTGVCSRGYRGPACIECVVGYARFGTDLKCMNCQDQQFEYVLAATGYLLIQILYIVLFSSGLVKIQASFKDAPETRVSLSLKVFAGKLLIDYLQALNIVTEKSFFQPEYLHQFYYVITRILPRNEDSLSTGCLFQLNLDNDNIYLKSILLIQTQAIIYICIAAGYWTVMGVLGKWKKSVAMKNFKLTVIAILYILQPGLLKTLFELFSCKNFNAEDSSITLLVKDPDTICWESPHLNWAIGLSVPFLLFWFVFPMIWLVRSI